MTRNWLVGGVLSLLVGLAAAQEPDADQLAIRATVKAYEAAFNSHDAKALANHWSPEAVYTVPDSGEQVVGREAIERQFEAMFQRTKNARLAVEIDSLQMVSPNVAVEHGTATFTADEQEPEVTSYTAVYVRGNGQWLLDRVTDREVPSPSPSHYEHLKPLEWMIGKWVDDDGAARIETDCQWTKNRNFMRRSFTVVIDGQIDMSGMQLIGWDPSAGIIRSWVFDSDGGFSQGIWTNKEDRWFIEKTGVLTDGSRTSALNIVKKIDDDTMTIQSVSRMVGTEILPNVEEVKVVRVSP